MNHVPRVRKADTISTAMGFDYRPCLVIGGAPGPVSLQFEQNLNPGGDSRAGRLHATKGEVMARRCQPATGVAYYESAKSLGQSRQHGFR
jgi:hypothetical protein